MDFYEKAGDLFLRDRASASQNRDTMQRLNLHAQNQGQQLWLQHVARGYGIDPATQPFLKPYGVEPDMNVTNNNYTPPSMPAPAPAPVAAPTASNGVLKGMAMAALMAAGVGTAGIGGYYAIDKALSGLPARVAVPTVPAKPMEFDIKWRNEPDKGGMQFDEVKPK